jgi:uncharacterized protein (DUF362 family)
MVENNEVYLYKIDEYNADSISEKLKDELFSVINPADKVIIKPNWVNHCHLDRPDDWDYVITHPDVITAVITKVLQFLGKEGEIVICDSPEGETDFARLLSRYPLDLWKEKAHAKGVRLSLLDLRDFCWKKNDGIIVNRTRLPGDPAGNVDVNLRGERSEFYNHTKSPRGYYGADFNMAETNQAHDGFNNLYRVSKTVIEADVFINIPKMKTHKKGGITCCLKNLVGINTYKNFLPHHSEGSVQEHGDQFQDENINSKIEGPLMAFLKQNLLQNTTIAKLFKPFKKAGRLIFGDTNRVIRSGNWYGNDTVWRMILDLNKVLFYAETDGAIHPSRFIQRKKYIGIVDGIIGGQGNGPLYPDPVKAGFIIAGSNPVSIDAVCAKAMGFDPFKIPAIRNAFAIRHYPICDFTAEDIVIHFQSEKFALQDFPTETIVYFEPHYGWKGHIEL